MTLTIFDQLVQGTPEWLEARAGILTASTIGQRTTARTIKPAMNDRSRGLCQTLIAERITGHVEPVFPNRAMTRGTLLEPEARRIYAEQTGQDVGEVGFARLDTDTYTLGSSPDGLVGETGGIEIKSPSAKRSEERRVGKESRAGWGRASFTELSAHRSIDRNTDREH